MVKKEIELKDTAELMCSDNYKERFKAEYFQLKIRCKKLRSMLDNWSKLDFKPNSTREILEAQYIGMLEYKFALEQRAIMENIEL